MTDLPPLYLAREALRLGTDRELRHGAATGLLTRVGVGVYVSTDQWSSMPPDEQYRTRVRGAGAVSAPRTQFSHDSAAALWRLPSVGRWPQVSHQLAPAQPGGSSRTQIRRHEVGLDPLSTRIDGTTVTSLARTVVDMACTTSMLRAVVMADAALRTPDATEWNRVPTSTAELHAVLESLLPYRGHARAGRVISFATGLAESPGESFARVQFHALGLPAPELQVPFYDELGLIGIADFYWRHLGLICEFDGLSKYGVLRRYQRGMTTQQVVIDEKKREDRMRRVSDDFVRLDWPTVQDRRTLAAHLRPHGLVASRS